MKKYSIILLVLLLGVNAFSEWVDIPENSEQKLFDHSSIGKEYTEVNFTLNGYNVETIRADETDYQKISYLNEGNSLEVGKPDLPKFTRLISIPDQGSVSFEIIYTEEEIVKDINIYPAQVLQSESDSKPFKFVIDEDYYNSRLSFPANIVEIGEPVILRDQRVVSVSINPFQYDPKDKTLRIVTNVDIVVTASGRGGINPKTIDKKKSRFFEPLYRSAILNYDSVIERDGEYQDPSYLFIYPNNADLLSELEDLTDWKHQKGFNVALASTAVTGTSTTSIKNYIQNAYDTWEDPPEFVCLVGDAVIETGTLPIIPTFDETWSGYYGEGDHPYSQLEGGDILADVILGRISFNSIIQLQTYVAKVLSYEKEPYMAETDWYDKSLMVADTSPSGPSTIFTNQSIIEMMMQHAPNIVATEVYSSDDSYTRSAMISNLNSGVSYFNYRGYIGMSGFYNSDIASLTNYRKLPFAVFLTCSTGSFASGESRSEAFIRAGSAGEPTGAIAAIGTATSGTHTNFNNCMDAGIYYGIFADGINNPGGAVNRGKLALYEHYPQNPGNYVDIFSHWNTLIGDPGVELWTGIPQDLVADYETQISPGTNYLEVTVTNDNGVTLENAWVTALMGDDEIFVTGYTDENGYIALAINASIEGAANLTVTKHNYIPHLGGFDVGIIDRFVNVFDVLIDDDNTGTSTGNDDELINPGEDIELNVSLKNFGSQTANSVTSVISTDNDFVTITDDVEDFGSIPSGNAVFCSDDFDISIAEDVLGGTEITLAIVIEDNIGNIWNDIIYLVVEGANLDAVDYSILDGGNGIIDPGEVAEMNVFLQNFGSVTANAVSGELTSTNSQIAVSDDIGYFGNIIAGEQGSNTTDSFEIIANTQIVVGTQVIMELHLYNADGYDNTTQFFLNVGDVTITDPVGPDSYSYFCYDDGDISYFNVPTYDWIEINSIGTDLNLYDPGDTGAIATINDLPITFRMYGEEYDIATVCSNGWIAPGGSSQASFMNSPIPGPQGPSPMIAPFWDDLRTGSGDVYWYHDSVQHFVVIEWDHMQNDYNSAEETFQVILYDANYYPTFTGDSEIKFQYKVINNTNSGSYPSQHGQYCSVGIEDHTGTVGLEYTFNNTYPTAAKSLQNQMALLFTTSSQYWGFIAGQVTLLGDGGNVDEVNITNGVTFTNPDQTGNYIYPQLPGTYDLTASLTGYTSITMNDINVIENDTTFVDFILEALPIPTGFISNVVDYNDVELIWGLPESSVRNYENSRDKNTERYEIPASDNSREHIGYKVYRDGEEIAEINDPAILSYSDLALAAGTYEYYITAIHELGESLPSSQDDVTITFPAPQNPQAVTQYANILVTWDEPATRALTNYKVYRNLIMIADEIMGTSYLDPDIPNGTYSYNIRAVYSGDYQSVLSTDAVIDHIQTSSEDILVPQKTYLVGNHPNPFNPETSISFALSSDSKILIQIYNIKGEKVKKLIDGQMDAGFHSTVWDGTDHNGKKVASGIYLYRFKTTEIDQIKKMMLIK